MFKIGIRLMAARTVHHFRANLRATSQIPRLLHGRPPSERSTNGNGRLSSLRTLSVVSLTLGIGEHVRADSGEDGAVVHEQQPGTEENNGNVDAPSKAQAKPDRVDVVKVLDNILYKMMDSGSRALLYGILGANVVVSSAFMVAQFLNRQPNPRPTLLRFLSRNFVLSLGWLSRGRWHVMLTCMFLHWTLPHLIMNTWGVFTGVWLCSSFLDVWQTAGLYFGGGLVGSGVSLAVTKLLIKPRYMRMATRASDGVNALWYYYMCAQDLQISSMPSFPFALLLKGIFAVVFVREVVGLRKFIRYGYTGTGRNLVETDHAAHLGGDVTGMVAYGISRAQEDIRNDFSSNKGNEAKEQEDRTENKFEAT